jgi:hypothetical protein
MSQGDICCLLPVQINAAIIAQTLELLLLILLLPPSPLLMDFLQQFQHLDYIALNSRMNDEWKRMWKEAVMALGWRD